MTDRPRVVDRDATPQLDERELARRQRLVARALGQETNAETARIAQQRDALARIEAARLAQERSALERHRERPRLTNPFDPGAPRASWTREGERSRTAAAVSQPAPAAAASSRTEADRAHQPRRRGPRRERRSWKAPRRKSTTAPSAAVLAFTRERQWTAERSQRLATRTKQNDAIIAHPLSAEAALRRLSPWSQAGVRRALRAQGWTLADEAGRRHVALYATWEDFGRPRAWARPRQIKSASGAVRFAGIAKYAIAIVGWCQAALAIALSGPSTTSGGADPIDVKTVQRHTRLAEAFGAVQVVHHNPDAEPELRGRPTASNPKGWAINEYWLPTATMHKPGFVGAWFQADGSPIGLTEALALELLPRAKRPRRIRERRAREGEQQEPPPIV